MFGNHVLDLDFTNMPRKRHPKSQIKTTAPVPIMQSLDYSPAAQAIAQRMAKGDLDYLKQNLVRIMIDSAKLTEEIEFKDLYLDGDKAVQVTERWLKKYDKRLEAAKKKSPDEYHEVADEMRIEIIAELATPAFRKAVDQRLQTLMDRLMTGRDTKKLEIVMMLTPALRMKSIPWGLCGLILEIYNRTMQQTMQEYEEDQGVFDAIAEALKIEGEENIDIFTILKHPDKLEQVFEAQPALRQRTEKQIWEMVEAFEIALARGHVELSLFSEEEQMLPFQRIKAEFGEPFTQVQPSEEMHEHIFEAVRQALSEIMTPERFRRFREDVDKTATNWLRTSQKWGAAIQFELGYLDGSQYEVNKFILAAFIGQIYRLGKEHNQLRQRRENVEDEFLRQLLCYEQAHPSP